MTRQLYRIHLGNLHCKTAVAANARRWNIDQENSSLEGHGFDSRWGTQKIYFLSNSTWERFFIYFTLSKSQFHLSKLFLFPQTKVIHFYSIKSSNEYVWWNSAFTFHLIFLPFSLWALFLHSSTQSSPFHKYHGSHSSPIRNYQLNSPLKWWEC